MHEGRQASVRAGICCQALMRAETPHHAKDGDQGWHTVCGDAGTHNGMRPKAGRVSQCLHLDHECMCAFACGYVSINEVFRQPVR